MKFAIACCLLASCYSCSPGYSKYLGNYRSDWPAGKRPDYSQAAFWAATPFKNDPSDSIPRALKNDYQPDNRVDVFFLHPTTLTDDNDARWNADISDARLNAKTDYSSLLYQASAFNEFRVFAPRYRQAHLRAYFTSDTLSAARAFDTAYADIDRAFRYYLEYENHGRPIIIAAHSQGATHAIRLLQTYFDGQPLSKQLVAAYVVGMYIPDTAFTRLCACSDSLATGCICGWRTYRQDYQPQFITLENHRSLTTNPLSWTTDSVAIGRQENTGSILRNFNVLRRKVAGAQVHNGMLWTRKPKFPGSFLMHRKNYHVGDINLYYLSIRHNLRTRVAAYFSARH